MLATGATWAGLTISWQQTSQELQGCLASFNLNEECIIFRYDLTGPEQAPGPEQALVLSPEQAPSGYDGPEQACIMSPEQAPGGPVLSPEQAPSDYVLSPGQAPGGNFEFVDDKSLESRMAFSWAAATMNPDGFGDEERVHLSSMNPAGTGTGPWPRWMPSFMQIHRSTLAPGERLHPRDHECVAWRRVSEKDSGHVLWNGPVAETSLEYVNSHSREVMVSEWWCPGGFYRALQMVDFNAPIIGFDHQGKESSLGPFWAGRSGSILEQIHEDQEEIPNAGHQTELQRCHHRLNLLARHARREHHSSVHDLDFVELFSPPRVIPHAQRAGLKVDSSHVFDLQHGWDVRKLSHRRAFRQYRKKHRPRMMMASPACKAFTRLRHIYQERMDPETCRRTVAEGHLMWNFAMEACEEQIADGNFFGLEHPRLAASWRLPRTQRLLRRDDVVLMSFDQCFFGLSVVPSGTLSRKSTCIATNNPWLALELVNAVCRGDHDHETLIGGLPRKAQEYPAELCSAITRGAQAVALGLNPPSFLESAEVYELTRPGCWFGEEEEEAEDETNPPNEPEQYTTPVSDSQRRLVQKVHVNTGHPDRLRMLRAFKAAGALPQVLRYIREEFGCEDCQLKRGPDNRRRAQLPRTF